MHETSGRSHVRATVRERVAELPQRFDAAAVNGLRARWELRVGRDLFTISVADHACTIEDGGGGRADVMVSTNPATWLAIDDGRVSGHEAFLAGRLEVRGNLDLAVRLQTLFLPHDRPRSPVDLEQVVVDADGTALSAYVVGAGDPMLLLHGLGASKVSWLPLLPRLAERHRMLVPDLPGHGESAKPRSDYSPRYFATVVERLLEACGVDRALVVGNSMGGRIALEVAARYPHRVGALVLLAPAIPGFRWRHVMALARVFPARLGGIPFPMQRRVMETLLHRLFADVGNVSPRAFTAAADEFIRVYRDPRARMAFFASLRQVVAEGPGPFWRAMRGVEHPTTVVVGERDRIVPPRLGVRLAEELPNATLQLLPRVGHVPQFEATTLTLSAIERAGR